MSLNKNRDKNIFMNTPIIRTKNTVIRAFERKDLKVFAAYRSQEQVAKYQSWTDYSYQDAIELFEGMDYSLFGQHDNWFQLAIALQETDELIGDLAVHFIDQEQVEIGFTVSPDYQGKNIASDAVACFLNYLFDELNKHRVVATTDVKNTASYRLLEKLGFRREAHLVQNVFFKGAWGDEYQYGLLRSEYLPEFS